MEWLSENWVFLLIAVAFVAMHLAWRANRKTRPADVSTACSQHP